MYEDELSDEEPIVGRLWSWPERAKGWSQVFLILAVLCGLVVLVWWGTRPALPYKITPAGERVAARFVNDLLVKYDCKAAAELDVNRQSHDLPRTNQRCARYVWTSEDLDQSEDHWYLVRGSGAIVHIHGRGNGDDYVSFQLITQRAGLLLAGELDVFTRRIHGRWMVASFGATSSGFCTKSRCGARWTRRVNVPLPASAHRLTVTLSKTHGPPGTRIVVRVKNCSKPFVQPYALEWFPGAANIPIKRTSRRTVTGVFVIPSYEDPGASHFDFSCGGYITRDGTGAPNTIATANFTVTR